MVLEDGEGLAGMCGWAGRPWVRSLTQELRSAPQPLEGLGAPSGRMLLSVRGIVLGWVQFGAGHTAAMAACRR